MIIFALQIAGWSSWQLVGLITQRSEVRVLPPLLRKRAMYSVRVHCFFVLCYDAETFSKKVDPDCRVTNRPQDTSLTPAPPLLHLLLSPSQLYPTNNRTEQLLRQPTTHTYPSCDHCYHSFLSTSCLHLSTLSPPIGCDTYFHNTDDRPPK